MNKTILEEAKEKIFEMAVDDVNKGKYSGEILAIINSKLCEIKQAEMEEENKLKEDERKKNNEEYAQLLAKMLYK